MNAFGRIALSLLATAAIPTSPALAEGSAMSVEEQHSATRQLAFDPARFFTDSTIEPLIAIRYTGDDYGYPVYSIAVRRGCTTEDHGEARKTCFNRLTARMVRAPGIGPKEGEGRGRRIAGAKVFARLYDLAPQDEVQLRAGIDGLGLDWLEADVSACPAALAHLKTAESMSFFAHPAVPEDDSLAIVLHADKIDFTYGEYLTRSRYFGYNKAGSPGAWANEFAASLADCWKPASATAPWLLDRPAEPEIASRY
jgi:hypothetical protein